MEVITFVKLQPVANLSQSRIPAIDNTLYNLRGKLSTVTIDPNGQYVQPIVESVRSLFPPGEFANTTYTGLRFNCQEINTRQPLSSNINLIEVCLLIQ
jgi:hypothetical protein